MKIFTWIYLAIFSMVLLIGAALEAKTHHLYGVLSDISMLLAPIVLAVFLLRGRAPLLLVAAALVQVFMPLMDAHKFRGIPKITIGMYVLLVPMFLGLIFVGWKSVQSKAT